MPGLASADSPKGEPDLSGYKTVGTAATAPITRAASRANPADSPAYLGILLDPEARQDLVITGVDPDSPASRADVHSGDILRKIDGQVLKDGEGLFEVLRGKSAGETLELELARGEKMVNARAILTPWSRMKPVQGRPRPGFGVQVAAVKDGEGVTIERVLPGSLADRSRLKVGEILLKIDERRVDRFRSDPTT